MQTPDEVSLTITPKNLLLVKRSMGELAIFNVLSSSTRKYHIFSFLKVKAETIIVKCQPI